MRRIRRPSLLVLGALAILGGLAAPSTARSHAPARAVSYDDPWGPAGLTLRSRSADRLVLNFSLEDWSLGIAEVNGRTQNVVRMPGVLLPNDAGAPDLPGLSHHLALPNGARATVRVLDSRSETFRDVDLAPAPEIPMDTDKGPLVYTRNEDVYARDADYPARPVLLEEIAPIRGVNAALLGVTPFRYNPVRRTLTVLRDVELEVVFEGGDGVFGEDRLRSPWFDPILSDVFLNADALAPVPIRDAARAGSRTPDFEYVIITPTAGGFVAWADTLRRFRSEQGIRTGVFTTDEIGGNTAAAIESFLDDAYASWDLPPVAVLLMGDHGTAGHQIMTPTYDSYCVSDNIYADVSGNHMPDLVLARMAASTVEDLETFVRKAMDYENSPPLDPSFYATPLIAGGWQTSRWFVLCDEVVYGFLANEHGKTPRREYAIYEGTPDTWSTATNTQTVIDYFGPNGLGYLPATPDHLVDWGSNATRMNEAINDGAFMVLHRDHGALDGWSEPDYRTDDLADLSNDALPFVFSVNCHTGKFDEPTTVFAEAFHRHARGALGLIAATEESFSFVNDTYIWGMMDHAWPEFDPGYGAAGEHVFRPAFASASGKYYLAASNWPYNLEHKEVTYYLFHHHGDAFTTVMTEVPTPLAVSHPAGLVAGVTSFAVTADAGALVGLSVDGELLASAVATGGPVALEIPAQTPGGELVVTATKQNRLRHRSAVPIVPASGPYVVFDSVVIEDAAGNGNGNLDFAEEVGLSIDLRNVGLDTAVGVSAAISSDDPHLTILDGAETYGDIPVDGVLGAFAGFQVRLDPTVPDGHSVPVTLTVTDAVSSYVSVFGITAHAPVLSVTGYGILDDADVDGVLDPGEEATLRLDLVNSGSAPLVNVITGLTSLNANVTVAPSAPALPALGAGASTSLDWTVTALPAAPIGEVATFQLDVTADDFAFSGTVEHTLGLSMEDFESGTLLAYPWLPGGDLGWIIDDFLPGEGALSARSGPITDGQSSQLILTMDVVADGEISFLAKVSSEAQWDKLYFWIDDVVAGGWTGNFGWERVSFPVTAGTHTFKWDYFKDGSNAAGEDCGWIDAIIFPPVTSPPRPAVVATQEDLAIDLVIPAAATRLLTLSNTGEGDLSYEIEVALAETRQTSVPDQIFKKDQADDRTGQGADRGAGGPDAYGYSWVDSDDPAGPAYAWVEINGVGTEISPGDEGNLGPFDLGFDFPFYGVSYDAIRITANGWLSFDAQYSSYNNMGIPLASAPNNLLAVFWDDLNPGAGGSVHYHADAANDRFIVEYDGVYRFSTTTPETFQVILDADGTITYQYKAVQDANSCTVGIENAAGNDGLQVVFNASYLHDELAIRFAYTPPAQPWLSVAPLEGVVPPGASADVEVLFNSADIPYGTYEGLLTVHTNDPLNPRIEFPVMLTAYDDITTGVGNVPPAAFALEPAHPNPFNPATTIRFAVPRESRMSLKVYDLGGRLVRTLAEGRTGAGFHQVRWDGKDQAGHGVPSGTYCYRLVADGFERTRKMLLVK